MDRKSIPGAIEVTQNVYCWQSGQIGFSNRGIPDGSLPIRFNATPEEVETIKARSRMSYDNKTMLVPGIPEAENPHAALNALHAFCGNIDLPAQEQKTKSRQRK